VGVVDKARATMSETGQWLRGTPTSATSENENAAEIGWEIKFLTVNPVERTAAPVAQPRGVAASAETACEAIVCVAAGWFRR